MMSIKTGSDKGFSLIELLIAITLLAVGLMAVAGMQTTAINANDISKKGTDVASLTQEAMEDVLSWNSKDLKLKMGGTSAYDLDPTTPGSAISIPGSGTYVATVTVTPNAEIGGIPQVNLSRIQVTTTGGNKTFTLIAYKKVE